MSENKFNFPRYLGYAKAIPESHQYDPALQKETLHYAFNDKHLLEAEISPGNVKLTEYYDEKLLSITSDTALDKALFSHYRDIDPFNFPIHQAWMNAVTDVRNVYADYIMKEHIKYFYYPALLLIDTRVPILETQIQIAEILIQEGPLKGLQAWIQTSQITTTLPDKVEILKIPLLSIIFPIAYRLDVLNKINTSGLISKIKLFRPMVSLAEPAKGSTICSFFGRGEDEWQRYNIVYQKTQINTEINS